MLDRKNTCIYLMLLNCYVNQVLLQFIPMHMTITTQNHEVCFSLMTKYTYTLQQRIKYINDYHIF